MKKQSSRSTYRNKGSNNQQQRTNGSSSYYRRSGGYSSPSKGPFWLALVLIGVITISLTFFLKLPVYVSYISGINLVTFGFYGYDKYQAKRSRWRVPELNLHWLAMLGGAFGGILGQVLFNHKTRKRTFHIVLWSSLLVHLVIFLAFSQILLKTLLR